MKVILKRFDGSERTIEAVLDGSESVFVDREGVFYVLASYGVEASYKQVRARIEASLSDKEKVQLATERLNAARAKRLAADEEVNKHKEELIGLGVDVAAKEEDDEPVVIVDTPTEFKPKVAEEFDPAPKLPQRGEALEPTGKPPEKVK